jgi:hypothetical protein
MNGGTFCVNCVRAAQICTPDGAGRSDRIRTHCLRLFREVSSLGNGGVKGTLQSLDGSVNGGWLRRGHRNILRTFGVPHPLAPTNLPCSAVGSWQKEDFCYDPSH